MTAPTKFSGRGGVARFAVLFATLMAALLACPQASEAKGGEKTPKSNVQPAWCAPEFEALSDDICYLDGGSTSAHRTLVIFLHGAIAKNTTWQWNHQRGLMTLAKGHNVEVIFPRSPESSVGYVWPGSVKEQEKVEQQLIDGWMDAKHSLEQRKGRAFDEVFVMGFSSGAYFVSSLAMRGRADVDGYAAFAGGVGMGARPTPVVRFSPVFVGVCADDETSRNHSRGFAGSLAAVGIPRAVNEQHVGHGLSHIHFAYALSYLRRMKKEHLASL